MALGKTPGVNIDLRKKRGRSSAGSNSPLGERSSLFRENLIAGLFWNLMSSCKTARWKRRPRREQGAMLVGGASRGRDRRERREGRGEEDGNTNVCGWLGREQVKNAQTDTHTCTYSYTVPGREVSGAPRLFSPPPGGRGSSGRAPGRHASPHLTLKVLFSSLLGYRPRCPGPCR